ncbi:uncharacterized protein EI90DRAFT_3053944 [Cantharellus anzutake]|uniref:uncharacterized protein n=1 Tax=Cantharellus anzutake TaxID=1750568 RepID=UPI0019068DF2|nr:uncharacterized protein EI90DRAFT_3053944 [Cantharellus anzutake]KAF8332663.1 hypothetical protein EI90DRAFT_3053944 [Cantharellus anzutake]
MKSLFRRARSTDQLKPKLVPSPLISLPEDVLIAVLAHVDVADIIRLRRVNKIFKDLTKTLIVWVHALKWFPLVLHHRPDTEIAQEIEDALVFSCKLEQKLSSSKLTTRSGWILSEAVGGELWTPNMCIARDYLVVSGSENGFLCVNLATKTSWKIPVPDYPVAHWVNAMEMTLKGELGLVVVIRSLERMRKAVVYFQPLPELPCDGRAHELITITVNDKISCAELSGSSVLVGSASGEITRVDLEHMVTQKYNVGGHIWDAAIYDQFLVVSHSSTGSRITIVALSPLNNLTDQNGDSATDSVKTITQRDLNTSSDQSREVFAVGLPKLALPALSTPDRAIRLFTHPLPIIHLAHSFIIPHQDSEGRVDAVHFNIPKVPFSSLPFLRNSTSWTVSCIRAGHSRAMSLISVRTSSGNSQELILTDVQEDRSVVHKRVNIHSKKLADSLLERGGELAWDEPSGRVCVCTRRARQKCVITVLEL